MSKHIAGWFWSGVAALVLSSGACATEDSDAGPGAGTTAGHNDGQSGTEGGQLVCWQAISRQPVGPDEVAIEESSVRQLVELLGGEGELPASWNGVPGPSHREPGTHDTTARIELTADPLSARRVTYAGRSCARLLELSATLRLRTLDGAFNGTLPGTLTGEVGGFEFKAEVPAEQGRTSLQSPAVRDDLSSENYVAVASWDPDPVLVHPVRAFKLTSFEFRRGIEQIAWRSDVQDAGLAIASGPDASALSVPKISTIDAGM